MLFGLDGLLRMAHPEFRFATMVPAHADEAAELLCHEFCRREPLCRFLRIETAELLPFFRQQTDHVARHGLGIVALDPTTGRIQGCITAEDHMAPFVPDAQALTPHLELIGAMLDALELPAEFRPRAHGEAFACGLAAIREGVRKKWLLTMMMIALAKHTSNLGYRRGYAKISNVRVSDRLRALEWLGGGKWLADGKSLRMVGTLRPADFVWKGGKPLAAYGCALQIFTWSMVQTR